MIKEIYHEWKVERSIDPFVSFYQMKSESFRKKEKKEATID